MPTPNGGKPEVEETSQANLINSNALSANRNLAVSTSDYVVTASENNVFVNRVYSKAIHFVNSQYPQAEVLDRKAIANQATFKITKQSQVYDLPEPQLDSYIYVAVRNEIASFEREKRRQFAQSKQVVSLEQVFEIEDQSRVKQLDAKFELEAIAESLIRELHKSKLKQRWSVILSSETICRLLELDRSIKFSEIANLLEITIDEFEILFDKMPFTYSSITDLWQKFNKDEKAVNEDQISKAVDRFNKKFQKLLKKKHKF